MNLKMIKKVLLEAIQNGASIENFEYASDELDQR